jgi:hypothetical protein
MNLSLRIATIGALLAVLGLSACVWDRGEYRGNRYGAHDRGGVQQRNGHDRNGRPCGESSRDGDGHHQDDCRPRSR